MLFVIASQPNNILFLIAVTAQLYDAEYKSFDAPHILPTSPDTTLELDTNFILTCESTTPVTWFMPDQVSNY